MKTYQYPSKNEWAAICARPAIDRQVLLEGVREIIGFVRRGGDDALRQLTLRFDGVELDDLWVTKAEFQAADALVDAELKAAIALAAGNIRRFHATGRAPFKPVETAPGVRCWWQDRPIERVGLYIPGGNVPLFSPLLMLAIPAQLAGCREIVVCTPANKEGGVDPVLLYTANYLGLSKILKLGGAQAIAAMGFGTESIDPVYKVFGAGNQYVAAAKMLVQEAGVAIDMPAGPSELLVVADHTAQAAFVAADLLSLAEHGADSRVVLVTTDPLLREATREEIRRQLEALPRRETATAALESGKAVLVRSLEEAMDLSNRYAPEHLIIATADPLALAGQVRNAGSVFLGHWTPGSVGDYASGTNRALPTNGAARAWSGVSVGSFVKKITFQQLDTRGVRAIGPAVEVMARAESLQAHANAVNLRLQSLQPDSVAKSDRLPNQE